MGKGLVSLYRGFFLYISLILGRRIWFVISRTSLARVRNIEVLLYHNKYSINCLSRLGEDSVLYLIVISSIFSYSFRPWVPLVGAVMTSQAGSHVISISYQLTRLMTTPWPRFLHPSWTGILPKDSMRPSEDWERWDCKQNWVLVRLTRLCRLDIVAVEKIDL